MAPSSGWRSSLLIGLAVVAAGMALSIAAPHSVGGIQFWVAPRHGVRAWIVPTDFWWAERAAAYIANGAFGYMYEAAPPYYGLPMMPLLLAPLVAIAQAFGLNEGALPAGVVPQPSMWLLIGPFVLATVIPLLYAVGALARELGVARITGIQVGAVFLVFLPALFPGGHVEDVLALAFVMLAVRAVLRGRSIPGALLFSLAISAKQWSVLGLPLVLLLMPRRDRGRAFLVAIALPAALAAFVLLVDFPHAGYSLFQAKGWVVYGRKAPFAVAIGGPYVSTTTYRLATFAVAGALALVLRRRMRAAIVPAAFGLCYLARFLLEPTPPAYYVAPAIAFFLVAERLRRGTVQWTVVVGAAVVAIFALPGSPWWWPAMAGLSLLLAFPAVQDLRTAGAAS